MIGRLRLLGAAAALVLAVAACGDDDDTPDAAIETEAPAETAAAAEDDGAGDGSDESVTPVEVTSSDADPDDAAEGSTTGLKVSGVTFDSGNAFIINDGDAPIDLTGHWICNRPNYSQLPDIELGPGEGIEVAVQGISPGGGEVAIYVSNDFASSDAIVSYVQWGDGGGRSEVAEDAGIWSGPPVEVTSDGIFLIGEPGSATGWE
jgi:hypothetical protein